MNLLFEPLDLEFVGFWPRVGASVIDSLLLGMVVWPLFYAVYGSGYWYGGMLFHGPLDFLIRWVFPAVAVVAFWIARGATPGKMVIGAQIVDARTGGRPSRGQMIGRYFGYYVSTFGFGLGFLWVAFDRRRQGWHDKLAGTVVVRRRDRHPAQVRFGRN